MSPPMGKMSKAGHTLFKPRYDPDRHERWRFDMASKTLPPADYLKTILDYNPETGALTWKCAKAHSTRVGSPAGAASWGYIRVKIDGQLFRAHRLIWKIVNGRDPIDQIDHINGNRSDNRIANLREASRSENNQNSRLRKSNTSGFKGVCWKKSHQKWVAQIRIDGKDKFLGCFNTPELAHAAYCEASKNHHGIFGRTA